MDGEAGRRLGQREGQITVRREGDGHVLYLSGDVDAIVVKGLESEQSVAELRVIAADVSGLNYIDSTGLALLVRWATDARSEGRPATIRGMTQRFERVLALAGLDAVFVRG